MPVITVDDYLRSLTPAAREVVEGVRYHVRSLAPEAGETLGYSMLSVTVEGRPAFYVGGWKRHVGLYPVPRFDDPLEDAVAPFRAATDTVRIPLDPPLPDVVRPLVAALLARAGAAVPDEPRDDAAAVATEADAPDADEAPRRRGRHAL